jgi:hypothetical protein
MKHEELLSRKPLETGQDPASSEELEVARSLYLHEENRFLQEELDIRRLPFVLDKLDMPAYSSESIKQYQDKVQAEDRAADLPKLGRLSRLCHYLGEQLPMGWYAFFSPIIVVICIGLRRQFGWFEAILSLLAASTIVVFYWKMWVEDDVLRRWNTTLLKYYKPGISSLTMRRISALKGEMPTINVGISWLPGHKEERPVPGTKTFLCIWGGEPNDWDIYHKAEKYYLPNE